MHKEKSVVLHGSEGVNLSISSKTCKRKSHNLYASLKCTFHKMHLKGQAYRPNVCLTNTLHEISSAVVKYGSGSRSNCDRSLTV